MTASSPVLPTATNSASGRLGRLLISSRSNSRAFSPSACAIRAPLSSLPVLSFRNVTASLQPISVDSATFKIYHNPLVNYVWLGGLVFIFGTLVAAWPEREPERQRRPAPARTAALKA